MHGHTLDLALTRSSDYLVRNVSYRAPSFSDPHPLIISCRVQKPAAEKKVIECRDMKNINIEQFKQDITSSKLSNVTELDISEHVEQYNKTLCAVLDSHAPTSTKEVRIRKHSPWYNEELSIARRKRRQAERRWNGTKLTVHLDILRQERANYNTLCRKVKSNFYQAKIENNASDQKSLYKIINQLKCKSSDQILPTSANDAGLANMFAEYFQEKIQKISHSFQPIVNLPTACVPDGVTPLTVFHPTTEEELAKIITSGNSKACSLDPIPTYLVKDVLPCLLPALTRLVNA